MADENYFLDKIDDPFAKSLTGTLWDIGKRFVGSTFDVLKDKNQSRKAAETYVDKYRNRYGLLKLLGMKRGVSLESIYTPVRILNELSIRQFESIEGLEEIYREKQNRRLQYGKCRSEDGLSVGTDKKNQYLMVLGGPGSGKSTYLRRLGLEAFRGETGRFQEKIIPVLLELKNFSSTDVDLIGALAEELKNFGFPPSKRASIASSTYVSETSDASFGLLSIAPINSTLYLPEASLLRT